MIHFNPILYEVRIYPNNNNENSFKDRDKYIGTMLVTITGTRAWISIATASFNKDIFNEIAIFLKDKNITLVEWERYGKIHSVDLTLDKYGK